MHKSLLSVSIAALLISACSPAEYQVNPPVAKEIPESEQEGYMRIIGDLRWDQLTSKEEWIEIFPECLTDVILQRMPSGNNNWHSRRFIFGKSISHIDNRFTPPIDKNGRVVGERTQNWNKKCKDFLVGGIPLTPEEVHFGSNSGTTSKTMTTQVEFSFFDNSQSRAVKATIAEKYTSTTDGYCSKYTCWDLGDDIDTAGDIEATPTPYTVSLLDQVKIDASDF